MTLLLACGSAVLKRQVIYGQLLGARELLKDKCLSRAGSRPGLGRRVGILSLHNAAKCLPQLKAAQTCLVRLDVQSRHGIYIVSCISSSIVWMCNRP